MTPINDYFREKWINALLSFLGERVQTEVKKGVWLVSTAKYGDIQLHLSAPKISFYTSIKFLGDIPEIKEIHDTIGDPEVRYVSKNRFWFNEPFQKIVDESILWLESYVN